MGGLCGLGSGLLLLCLQLECRLLSCCLCCCLCCCLGLGLGLSLGLSLLGLLLPKKLGSEGRRPHLGVVHLGEAGTGGDRRTNAGPSARIPSGEGRGGGPGCQALEIGPDVPTVGSSGVTLGGLCLGLGLLEQQLLL